MAWKRITESQPPPPPVKPVEQPPPAENPPVTVNPQTVSAEDRNLMFRQNNLGGDTLKAGLFARFDRPGGEALHFVGGGAMPSTPFSPSAPPSEPLPPPVDENKVNDATASIKDSLSQGFTDWDVTRGDLENVQQQFQGLNAEEANRVFDNLSDDELRNWNQELNGISGSYSKEERQQLFDELAGQLNGENLSRMADAMGNENDVAMLAHSVGRHAAPEAKVEFINSRLGDVESDPTAALAVAETIGGMKDNPAELERVLSQMSPAQLSAVMRGASDEFTSSSGGSVPVTSFDTAPLAAMIDAVSGISNPELKAAVFQNGALEMERIAEAGGFTNPTIGNDTENVRDALTTLLNSDTTGVIDQLEANYRNGNGLTTYVKSMLEGGKTDEIGQIIAKLAKGNSLTEDPMTRFTAESIGDDGRPYKHNAQFLGYFGGAVLAAARQITDDTKTQGDMLKNIFGTIAGATGAANPAAGVASSILNGLTQATVDNIVDQVNNGTLSMAEGLAQLTFPQNPETGRPYNGGTETDYDAAVGRVLDHNPPG